MFIVGGKLLALLLGFDNAIHSGVHMCGRVHWTGTQD